MLIIRWMKNLFKTEHQRGIVIVDHNMPVLFEKRIRIDSLTNWEPDIEIFDDKPRNHLEENQNII